uniref:O-fucosyltransferase family protein n=1 Tax=Chlamydomonas leiostraca TaxID=1034604 RepID=A0A7S0RHX8_9CHLO|mmetsp:Transcript_23290/g.59535  ORF Transcript_23290/g.59535 Transcript_23290/m.59535 type:complete len:368 (+) Transcript_23290:90-1193(+)|eukprot:CAMPEP_0202862920 /NCGR_PEP_ID=MMETSP1391-20130828/3773_1 /ASSEMBLY_ACC=CAM_ASM_000867 /TAXON_ID=1034604 /ORGANISM="Chlamydomonas leiostraca, Strain SAG 11-49" /LENGTH=367 /DNA_ID=CAMNT_0049542515 /DNA_START=89 /DNA_END=1189 /DNA_ORIENTATION=-
MHVTDNPIPSPMVNALLFLTCVFVTLQAHSRAVFTPDPACPVFATQPIHPEAGLGHRYGNMVFGLILAMRLNVTYMFDPVSFQRDYTILRKGRTLRGYHKALSLLGLHAFVNRSHPTIKNPTNETRPPLSIKKLNRVELMSDLYVAVASGATPLSCWTVYELCEECCLCCDGCCPHRSPSYCFMRAVGAFNYVKELMRHLKKQALPYMPDHQLFPTRSERRSDTVIVCVHLRVGDIDLVPLPEFFPNVYDLLRHSFRSMRVFVFIGMPEQVKQFAHIDVMEPIIVSNMSTEDTIHHWCESDVLIATGSSLPTVAFTSCSVPVMMSTIPKDGVKGCSDIEGVVWLTQDGRVFPESRSAHIANRVQMKW